jgi:hypothetical protein
MDTTGVELTFGTLGVIMVVAVAMGWLWRRQRQDLERTEAWPIIQATIESGRLERVTESRAVLPTFAFSYQIAGEYYSGRFSLVPANTDPGLLIDQLAGRKLLVRCNPRRPDIWFIPDERIEGCKVEQKLGPHLVGLYPQE